MAGKLGIGLLLLLAANNVPTTSGTWSKIAPRAGSLPDGEPPSSFERRDNTIDPVGVSSELDARPALLHTNKFYSNFVVSECITYYSRLQQYIPVRTRIRSRLYLL